MQDEPTRVRISILAFDEATALWRAVHDLLSNGFVSGQFGFIGLAVPLAQLAPPSTFGQDSSCALSALLADRAPLQLPSIDAVVDVRCVGHAARVLTGLQNWHDGFVRVRPEVGNRFASDVVSGRIVLVVTSITADQQALGARILLRHGNHDLNTHEFSMPRSAST